LLLARYNHQHSLLVYNNLFNSDAPHITLHDALVSKMLPPIHAYTLKIVVQTVNHVWGRTLNHRIFM